MDDFNYGNLEENSTECGKENKEQRVSKYGRTLDYKDIYIYIYIYINKSYT